jgi:nucleoside-diphosphate-sugar epimerase
LVGVAKERVAVIGGAGYVGAELQQRLVDAGFEVTVLDTFWYPAGRWATESDQYSPHIRYVTGDVRSRESLNEALSGAKHCIHLACISNDPSYELNPDLAKSINFDAFGLFVDAINSSLVERLIYASSSSVYGVKTEPEVTEDLPCLPLTDYSRYKIECERMVLDNVHGRVTRSVIRPSTVCGVSRRQRFDLVVNILTLSALTRGTITVDGGTQYRPNLHIDDMTSSYITMLKAPRDRIDAEIFNVAGANLTVLEIAQTVKSALNDTPTIEIREANDLRSYRVSGKKIQQRLGFVPVKTVRHAVQDLVAAFNRGAFADTNSEQYFNIRRMKSLLSDQM